MWLPIYLLITVALFILYAIPILLYRKWFTQLKPFLIPEFFKPKINFSIIIPARNEEKNIIPCLQSIFSQNYPEHLFEVIVIDDHSTDETANRIKQFQQYHSNLKLICLEDKLNGEKLNSYKKKAIENGIEISTGDWIVTTDADCAVTKNWLLSFAAIIEKEEPVFVAAPVAFCNDGSLLSTFQNLDFITLQGITAASVSAGFHSMCNGANLAYKKSVFYGVDGFNGIDKIASGDDMMLMNKIKQKFPSQLAFLFSKDAIVTTHPMPDWKSFLNQRIRWASKADQLKDKNVFGVLLLVYLLNLSLFFMPLIAFFKPIVLLIWLLFLLLKSFVELLFLLPVGKFFDQSLLSFPLFQPMHIAYTVIAGWFGKFGNYHWKGRQVK
ncbi:MAG TPA: glycosyltransferase [Chitinophagaceae bacterium]|nr:glycosyltransferase [Chitinophagaceae bacterium]